MVTKEEMIEQIISDFDFVAVHQVIEKSGLKWAGEIPTIGQLVMEAQRLLKTVIPEDTRKEGNVTNIMTHGFVAGVDNYAQEKTYYLMYVIRESSYCINSLGGKVDG